MILPILVGYDGSEHSRAAVELAVAEARFRRHPVTVMYAAPVPVVGLSHEELEELPAGSSAIKDMMDEISAHIHQLDPHVTVRYEVVNAITVSSRLVEESVRYSLLVLGNRGRGGFTSLLLGSTSTQVAAHAHCPVIVARERATSGPHRGTVVVGVDGSELSDAAVGFAFEEARLRRVPLTPVRIWTDPLVTGPDDLAVTAYDRRRQTELETRQLEESLAPWRDRYSDVVVSPRVAEGSVRDELLELSRGCELLVVGSRGHGGFTGMILGSTSVAMLHHAQAPVAIVHRRHDE